MYPQHHFHLNDITSNLYNDQKASLNALVFVLKLKILNTFSNQNFSDHIDW